MLTTLRRHAPIIWCTAMFALQLAVIATNPFKYQWDMRSYLYAPRAVEVGLDPYELDSLRTVAPDSGLHSDELHPFYYPPQELAAFWPLSRLGYRSAFYSYLAFQILVLAALLWFGKKWLAERAESQAFLALAPLLFGGAIATCLRSGNIALLESCLLTAALWALSTNRWLLFAALVAVAANFKVIPIALLVLLVAACRPPKWIHALAGLGIFALPFVAAYVGQHALFEAFLSHSPRIGSGRAPIDLSLACLLHDRSVLAGGAADGGVALLVYVALALAMVAVTALGILRLRSRGGHEKEIAALTVLAYVTVSPRLLPYSLALAAAPVVRVTMSSGRWSRWLMFAALVLPTAYISRYIFHEPDLRPPTSTLKLVWEYWSWFVVAAAWLIALRRALARREGRWAMER